MKIFFVLCLFSGSAFAQYMGQYSTNPYAPNSTGNQNGVYGSPYGPGINNPYGAGSQYGSTGTYSNGGPKLYDSNGDFHGNVNSNPYDPNSVSNPYGQYGSPYSPNSVNNPNGVYGSPYGVESPNNPYGQGLKIIGDE